MHMAGQTLATVDVMTNSAKRKPVLADVDGDSFKITEQTLLKSYRSKGSLDMKAVR